MDKGNTETVLFGSTATAEAPKPEQAKEEVKSPLEQSQKENISKETTENQKTPLTDDSTKPEEKPEDKAKTDAPKEQEQKPKETETLKVDFSPKKETEAKTSEKAKEETPQLTESQVKAFLSERGIKIENLDDLAPKSNLSPEVEEFKKFNEETKRGLDAYYNSKKDWSKESQENRIKEYLKYQNPTLSDDVIQKEFETYQISEDDRNSLDERELKRMEVALDKLDSKSLSYLNKKSKEFAIPEKQEVKTKERSQEEIDASYKPYRDSRDKSLEKLKDIRFNVEGLGEITLPIESDDKKLVTDSTQTVESFLQRWQEGDSLNTDSLVEDQAWGIKPIRQKLIVSLIEQVNTLFMDKFSKENRNVNLNEAPKQTENSQKSGLIIQGDNAKQEKEFGQPLI